jgi:hypothetical protein
MKKDEMGGECSTQGRYENCIQIIFSENVQERYHSEDLGVVDRIILELILKEIVLEVVDWMHLVQDRDQWRAVVNLRVS